MPDRYEPTERTTLTRKPERGTHEREVVHQILDEALHCHLGFVHEGHPFVIPTIHARHGETLYLHGSPVSRALGVLKEGVPCCVTATLVDGVVLARSARTHSLNYRSAVVLGIAAEVTDPDEKQLAMRAVVEHIVPGRAAEAREPTDAEARGTEILSLQIEEASAKVRDAGVVDATGDMELPVWAGLLPVSLVAGEPIPDPELDGSVPLPDYIKDWARPAEPGA